VKRKDELKLSFDITARKSLNWSLVVRRWPRTKPAWWLVTKTDDEQSGIMGFDQRRTTNDQGLQSCREDVACV